MSEDGCYLLVSLADERINLWDIRQHKRLNAKVMNLPPRLVRTFKGHKRKRYIVRACFCGLFIASGSEDSNVHVWGKASGRLVGVFVGHSDTVNCVSWNRAHPRMLASGSDDRTVIRWAVNAHTYQTVLTRELNYMIE
ncbi:hypothetical protein ACP275_13G012800 [Erythranthe tilingii]